MIRSFRPADLTALCALWLQGTLQAHPFIPASYWEENLELVRSQLPQAQVFVWEQQGVPKAFLGLTDSYIAGLFVSSECRSQGVGSRLLDLAKALCPQLSLNVYQRNTRAVRFYEREGFYRAASGTDPNTGQVEFTMQWPSPGEIPSQL